MLCEKDGHEDFDREVADMGIRITAIALWTALTLQFLPALLWAEGANFRAVPSPVVRQIHRVAEGLLDSGLGLFTLGGHRLTLDGQMWR